jgi:Concanavalin A-like lectin/glucanases superfamily/Calcineurin-like phosphoesterase
MLRKTNTTWDPRVDNDPKISGARVKFSKNFSGSYIRHAHTISQFSYFLEECMITTKRIFSIALLVALGSICIHEINAKENFSDPGRAMPDFNFVALGDWGCQMTTRNNLNHVIDKKPVLILGLGDYSYNSTADCWLDMVASVDKKIKVTLGNHDRIYSNQVMDHFNLSKPYYSFNFQNTHFAALSTEIPYDEGSEQYAFIKNDLARADSDLSIKWIIVFFHHPIYTSPSVIPPNVIFRDIYHPLFDKYHVDFVLQGHAHNYQRSYPLKYNPSNSSNPIITDLNSQNHVAPQGPIFLIAGTGGESLYGIRCQAAFTVAQRISFGFLEMQIYNNGSTTKGRFYDTNGSITDEFIIDKSLAANAPGYHYEPYITFSGPNSTEKVTHANKDTGSQLTVDKSLAANASGYHYEPFVTVSGSNYADINNSSSLQLLNFSVAAWFQTASSDSTSNVTYIVNKGGMGSDSNGTNMNYGLWMTKGGKVQTGFESTAGKDHFITSSSRYDDGRWHYAVATYDGSKLRLYIDGFLVASRLALGMTPDSSSILPVRIGANSLVLDGFFIGNIDEIRIWNTPLTISEIRGAYYNDNEFSNTPALVYVPSASNTSTSCPTK